MFKVGDMAVYPSHGVGVIESIENRVIMGCKQSFYVMKILGNNMKIMSPRNGARSVGLRHDVRQIGDIRHLDAPMVLGQWKPAACVGAVGDAEDRADKYIREG